MNRYYYIIFIIIIFFLIVVYLNQKNTIENMENIDDILIPDQGNRIFTKAYKDKLKKHNIKFIERGVIRKNIIKPIHQIIKVKLDKLDHAMGLIKNFKKNVLGLKIDKLKK